MPDQLSTSAALRFTELELGGPCTEISTIVPIFALQDNIVAQQNPDRVGLIIQNVSTVDAYVNISYQPVVGGGIYLSALGGVVSMNVRDDFTIPSREWHCSVSGPTQLLVIEIVRFKEGVYNT